MTATDTTLDALLRSVLAVPHDDLPRMVAADWYEENGQEDRAEFVRVQCAIARINTDLQSEEDCFSSFCTECNRRRTLQDRERELFKGSGPAGWWDDLPGQWRATVGHNTTIETADGFNYQIRRGFVSSVTCYLALWVGEQCGDENCLARPGDWVNPTCYRCRGTGRTPGAGPALVAQHPIERVVITDREPSHAGGPGLNYFWSQHNAGSPNPAFMLSLSVYPTRNAALLALSTACLAWARAVPPA